MLGKAFSHKKFFLLGFLMIFFILMFSACEENPGPAEGNKNGINEKPIVFTGNGLKQERQMSLLEMQNLPDARVEQVYSIINNWPSKKKFAAKGVKLRTVLEAAGIKDEARLITIKGQDGYECSFTREQLLETTRYYFPGIMEGDPAGAIIVEPIIACEYIENSDDLTEAREDSLCFILPQAHIDEQTQQVFVKDINEINVSVDEPGQWSMATIFPEQSRIAQGDTVKLQHKDLGRVKMYYTLDGSIPDENSRLYNPSTYQPELNKAIVIEKDSCIKVLVKGFGKYDSGIAEFHVQIK